MIRNSLPQYPLQLLMKCTLLIIVSAGIAMPLQATHIVGAELTYECISQESNTYEITIRFLRDCGPTAEADFDNPIQLFAFSEAFPGNYLIFEIVRPNDIPNIVPEEWNLCTGAPYNLCVEEAIYQRTITLPPQNGGWLLAWARCCRNGNITNLDDPLDQGVTFLARIPSPSQASACNSMPSYDNQMPIFICAGEDFYFDHSATDLDGDSLVYAITDPFGGLNFQGVGAGTGDLSQPGPVVGPTNPMGPPPYFPVIFDPGYTGAQPFGPNSTQINPVTGLLHINAPTQGVFVIAISVFEYRNGILLSENKKDLQVHVINCLPQNDPPEISQDFTGLNTIGDTILVEAETGYCYTVTVTDSNQSDLDLIPISTTFSGLDVPTITITTDQPGLLIAEVCWNPGCDFVGADLEFVLLGTDQNNCPIYNPAVDTAYVRVLPLPDVLPEVTYDISGANFAGTDTIIAELDSGFCFLWNVQDTSSFYNGDLSYTYVVENVNGGSGFVPLSIAESIFGDSSGVDSILIDMCWQAGCANVGETYRMILRGVADAGCPPNNFDLDTIYFVIPDPVNPPPLVGTDISGNPLNQDTILVDVHDIACFTFSVEDTFPAVSLDYEIQVMEVLPNGSGGGIGGPAGGLNPTVTIISTNDSLYALVCWMPVCENVDGTFALVVEGIQENDCQFTASNFDTVYIHVDNVVNPPPEIGHDFFPGWNVVGDTVIIPADSAACYHFYLLDNNGINSYLSVTGQVYFSDGTPHDGILTIQIETSTNTQIKGNVCFVPGCEYLEEDFYIVLTGRDTFDCSESNWVYDTVYIDVIEPYNNPPEIQHFLDGLPVVGGVVEVEPAAESYCYRVELADPDSLYADLTAEGVGRIFDEFWRYGNPAEITVILGNPLIINVCWAPSCYDSDTTFDIRVCGRDTSRCALTEEVCDVVTFRILPCSLLIQNVFSPNSDGINDVFEPFSQQGVDYYVFDIFDRWGRLIHSSKDGLWDGTFQNDGRQVPEGVYYFVIEYQFLSARGIPLKEREVGYVTLLR